PMRLGAGPVFAYEWLITARKWQVYALRSLFVAALLVGLALVWASEVAGRQVVSIRQLASIGQRFYYALVGTQLALVLLAAPAATAGAICLDKGRGTLAHLLVTDLSDAEIVLGKLAARLVPALGLVACALPVTALATLLGGIDPEALVGSFLVTAGLAVLGCALALALSVWGTKTHEVLLAAYLVVSLWLLVNPILWALGSWWGLGPVPAWVLHTNPFWLCFAPYNRPGSVGLGDFVIFLGMTLLLSAALAGLAVARVRSVSVRQMNRPIRAKSRGLRLIPKGWSRWRLRLPGPSLDGNPVLWREWHRRRPSRWAAIAWGLYIGMAGFFSVMAALSSGPWSHGTAAWVNGLQVSVGLLLVSVSAATSLAEERVRGSLDVLLATPLPTRTIVWGKWWGAYRVVPALTVLPVLLVSAMALRGSPEHWLAVPLTLGILLAQGAAITSLGLALATWIPRLGRAVGLTVTAYVLVAVGWLFVVLALWMPRPRSLGEGLMGATPFFSVGNLTYLTVEDHDQFPEFAGWVVFWIVVYTAAAVLLLLATLLTFNRALGRMTERAESAPVRPLPKLKPETVFVLD
ncbi:MAG: ABC transporter permease, partial [Isosphaeraceae bacterium]|nr:ABC transporter permease [Isosphaeraceae bacterium]